MIRNVQGDSHIISDTIATITLNPHSKREYVVGVYEAVLPQPALILEFSPGLGADMFASLVRIDGAGDYTLMYYFTNKSATTYKVTIHTAWKDEAYHRIA